MNNSPYFARSTTATLLPNGYKEAQKTLIKDDIVPLIYNVEHLASFAVDKNFELLRPDDGIKKLKGMIKNNTIYPQPMIFKILSDRIVIKENNGNFIEEFWFNFILDPTAHQSSNPDDIYNNIIIFKVLDNDRKSTEMHIFQCLNISSDEVAENLHNYMRGNYKKFYSNQNSIKKNKHKNYKDDDSPIFFNNEFFETDVNTLNRCFDDIEKFVARIQSIAIAHRELELRNLKLKQINKRLSKKEQAQNEILHERNIIKLRYQMPLFKEFYELFQKFKLSLNLLAKLKDHIHDPNAPELLHFLFTPLSVALESCQWSHGQNIAKQVISPLLSIEACNLLRECLTPKEYDLWMELGKSWRTPPEDWIGNYYSAYKPPFSDEFGPYELSNLNNNNSLNFVKPFQLNFNKNLNQRYSSAPPPIHRGVSVPTSISLNNNVMPNDFCKNDMMQSHDRSFDNYDLHQYRLEKERLEIEKMKVLDRENQILEHERRIRQEKANLEEERRRLHREAEKNSIACSDNPDFYRQEYFPLSKNISRTGSVQVLPSGEYTSNLKMYNYPNELSKEVYSRTASKPVLSENNEQKNFLEKLQKKQCKIVQVIYDRIAQNPKELTVTQHEYLEVLNDSKNWWECRNIYDNIGYLPHTILSVIATNEKNSSFQEKTNLKFENLNLNNEILLKPINGSNIIIDDNTPDYIRERQGKRGEFRYF